MERAFFLGTERLHSSGKRIYNVFKYAIRSSTSFGSSPYWKPGISGPPFKIKPRNTFIWSGVASLNWPLRIGPMTGGDPNLSFLGRWQSEQRCRNKPSPRLASSLSFSAPGGVAAGLFCANKFAVPPQLIVASQTTVLKIILLFKMIYPRIAILVRLRRHARTNLLYCYPSRVSTSKIRHFGRNFAILCESLRGEEPPNHWKNYLVSSLMRGKCGSWRNDELTGRVVSTSTLPAPAAIARKSSCASPA